MKKLSLKKLKLERNDLLERNQLKQVFGGYGGSEDDCKGYAKVVCKAVNGSGGTSQSTSYSNSPVTWGEAMTIANNCSNGYSSVTLFGC